MDTILCDSCRDVVTKIDQALLAVQTARAERDGEFPENNINGKANIARYDDLNKSVQDMKKEYRRKKEFLEAYIAEINSVSEEVIAKSPSTIRLGSIRLTRRSGKYNNHVYDVPRMVKFPLTSALWMPSTRWALRDWVYQVLCNLLEKLPTGQLNIYAADPRQNGSSLDPFLPLLQAGNLFPDGRILTSADEIERMLQECDGYIAKLLQECFVGGIKDWRDYNKANPAASLSYRIQIMISAPEQLTDKSMTYLSRILTDGPRCGVLPFILLDETMCNESDADKLKQFAQSVKDKAVRADGKDGISLSAMDAQNIAYAGISGEALPQFIERIKAKYVLTR